MYVFSHRSRHGLPAELAQVKKRTRKVRRCWYLQDADAEYIDQVWFHVLDLALKNQARAGYHNMYVIVRHRFRIRGNQLLYEQHNRKASFTPFYIQERQWTFCSKEKLMNDVICLEPDSTEFTYNRVRNMTRLDQVNSWIHKPHHIQTNAISAHRSKQAWVITKWKRHFRNAWKGVEGINGVQGVKERDGFERSRGGAGNEVEEMKRGGKSQRSGIKGGGGRNGGLENVKRVWMKKKYFAIVIQEVITVKVRATGVLFL